MCGSTCSSTSKRVTTSKVGFGVDMGGDENEDPDSVPIGGEDDDCEGELRASSVVFSYLKRPDCISEYKAGSARACDEAIFIIVGEGSMARIEDARVADRYDDDDDAVVEDVVALPLLVVLPPSGIVRASDSAKMPPPQPISRYFNAAPVELSGSYPPLRHCAIKSWRRGFIRCKMREGPSGSHQLLASEEKWVISSWETEVEE